MMEHQYKYPRRVISILAVNRYGAGENLEYV